MFSCFLGVSIHKSRNLSTSNHTNDWDRSLSLKIKGHWAISTIFSTLVAKGLKLKDDLMCLTASLKLKQCREYMQEGGRKVEATSSTRFHITLWNIIGSDQTSYYIDGPIHSVFAESPTGCQFYVSGTQIRTIYYYITEVYCLKTIVGSVRYLTNLLKYTMFYYVVELYPTNSHCWAIPNPNTLFRFTQVSYFAELNRKSLHCQGIPNSNTFIVEV